MMRLCAAAGVKLLITAGPAGRRKTRKPAHPRSEPNLAKGTKVEAEGVASPQWSCQGLKVSIGVFHSFPSGANWRQQERKILRFLRKSVYTQFLGVCNVTEGD